MTLPLLRLKEMKLLEKTIKYLGGEKELGEEARAIYSNYISKRSLSNDDVRGLVFQKHPEWAIIMRPPLLAPLEDNFKKLRSKEEVENGTDNFENILNSTDNKAKAFGFMEIAFNHLRNEQLTEALNLSEDASIAYPPLRSLYLEIIKFSVKYYIYKEKYYEASSSLYRFDNAKGDGLWYLLYRGIIQQNMGNIKRAEFFYISLEELSIKENNNKMLGSAILYQGILNRFRKNFKESISKYKTSYKIFKSIGDKYCMGMALANCGIAFRMDGKYDQAIKHYKKAIEIFDLVGDNYRKACVQGRLGTAYRQLKKYPVAIENYNKSMYIFKNCDKIREGYVLKELAATYQFMGEFGKSIFFFEQAREIFHSAGDESREARVWFYLGTLYLIAGDLIKAKNCFNEAINLNMNDSFYEAQILHNLGILYLMQGKWINSAENFSKSLDIFSKLGDKDHKILTLICMGTSLRMLDQFRDSYKYFNDALNLIRGQGPSDMEGWILGKIGNIHTLLHQNREAVDSYNLSLSLCENISNEKERLYHQGWIIGELGHVHRKMGLIEESIDYYNKSLKIFEKLNDSSKISWISGELGDAYKYQGRYYEARDVFIKALALLKSRGKLDPMGMVNLAEVHLMAGSFKGAIQDYSEALKLIEESGDLSNEAKILCRFGDTYRRIGEYQSARIYLKNSLEIARRINDRDQEAKTLCYMGISLINEKEFILAEENLMEALRIFKELDDRFLSAWVVEQQAIMHLMKENLDNAIASSNEVLKLDPDNLKAKLVLASCYRKQKMCEEYKTLSNNLMKIDTSKLSEYDRSCALSVCMEENEAFQLLQSALAKRQCSVERIKNDPFLDFIRFKPRFEALIKRFMGVYLLRIAKYDEALINFSKSCKISKQIGDLDQMAKSLCYIGITFGLKKWYGKAEIYLKKAIRIFVRLKNRALIGWSMENLGKIYLMRNDRETGPIKKSMYILRSSIKNNPTIYGYELLAVSYKLLKNNAEYDNCISLAKSLLPSQTTNEYERACFFGIIGEYADAIRHLKAALENHEIGFEGLGSDPCLEETKSYKDYRDLEMSHRIFEQQDIIQFL